MTKTANFRVTVINEEHSNDVTAKVNDRTKPLILDIDLDYFATEILEPPLRDELDDGTRPYHLAWDFPSFRSSILEGDHKARVMS